MIFKSFMLMALALASCAFSNGESLKDKVTIITNTSVMRSNPSTKLLEVTQKSLSIIPGFSECHRIIVFDGVHRRQRAFKDNYEQYKQNVIELTKTHPDFANTTLVFCKEHKHLALALKEGMDLVTTPFVFVHQHDFQIKKPVDSFGIIRSMEANPNLKHIRLHRRWNIVAGLDYRVDEEIEGPHYVPLCRTFGWSDNDHFTRKSYYDEFIFPKITKKWPMEWLINPLEKTLTQEDSKNHRIFGTYLYGKKGDGKYLLHLDGKRWKS